MGWFWKLDQLPDTPESHYLAHLMAGHDFQEALKNYRDLRFVSARLDQWASDIGIYHDMLATRRTAFANRLPAVLKSKRVQDLAKLAAARDRYAEELAHEAGANVIIDLKSAGGDVFDVSESYYTYSSANAGGSSSFCS